MKVSQLINMTINESVAYIIGLAYPLIKIKEINGVNYLISPINHNPNMIDNECINSHFLSVIKLIKNIPEKPMILSNNSSVAKISRKLGFSLLLVLDVDILSLHSILNEIVLRIKSSTTTVKKYFLMGCFDGRSSYDKTFGFLSIDVDRDYEKQDIINLIASEIGIFINLNRRDKDQTKNDQLRIRKKCLPKYLKEIGFLSLYRKNIIEKSLY
ncbi:hypothetical protein [Mycoplasma simbae]|uniref:hypothetical protein n=1 Tax=Mycoplasma simbae TaxID=36744 RepID=UPI00049655C9|nr:hypothetical protein [Mycoplasma simbae]